MHRPQLSTRQDDPSARTTVRPVGGPYSDGMAFNTTMGLVAVVLGLAWVLVIALAGWPPILYAVGGLDLAYGAWLLSKRPPS